MTNKDRIRMVINLECQVKGDSAIDGIFIRAFETPLSSEAEVSSSLLDHDVQNVPSIS